MAFAPVLVSWLPVVALVLVEVAVAEDAEGDALGAALGAVLLDVPADAAGEGLVVALGLEAAAPFAAAGETLADAFGEAVALTLADGLALGDALTVGEEAAGGEVFGLAAGDGDAPIAGVTEAAVDAEAPVCPE